MRARASAIVPCLLFILFVAVPGAGDARQDAEPEPPATAPGDEQGAPLLERVEHRTVDNDGVAIHYVVTGEGPLLVLLHGFPDYWYTWRHLIEELEGDYRLAAIDLRGYNRSGRPAGVASYAMPLLISDVAAVIADLGAERATIVGHDWGGAIAWSVAMFRPDLTERLIILNLPHPNGIRREIATNPQQQANSAYARRFQEPDAHLELTAEGLAAWVTDEAARPHYLEAFRRSDFEAMLAYYKANFPGSPAAATALPPMPPVKAPVLMIHGLDDQALLASGLDRTWEWLESDLTLVTIPGAGHFVQHDATELVNRSIRMWLER